MAVSDECQWCRIEITGDGVSRNGIGFCSDDCADEFEIEWGEE
jgi:hypothetical protein